ATEEVVDLRTGEIDMAIRYAKYPPADLESKALYRDCFFPVCSPRVLEGLPQNDWVNATKQMTLLHYHWRRKDPDAPSWALWRTKARMVDPRAEEIDIERGLTLSEEFLAIEAAIAGQGVVLASSVLVQRELQAGLLKCVCDVRLPGRTFYA
ncbi:MAG: LysR substrate-binding domain-containing protein, partial [Pseudomonadota bacterium]